MNHRRRNRGTDTDAQAEAESNPLRCRDVDDALLERTIELFQKRTNRTLSKEDARQIVENVTGLFRVLRDWSRAEKQRQKSLMPDHQVSQLE